MRICTYNVRNLFLDDAANADADANANADADVEASERDPYYTKSPAEFRNLVKTIGRVNADVLCLQEVSTRASLEKLNAALERPLPHVGFLPGNSNRGIQLAMLSRYPLCLSSHAHLELTDEAGGSLTEYDTAADAAAGRTVPLRFQRDLLLGEIDAGPLGKLAIFNTHLKSKTNRPWRLLAADTIRVAECQAISRIIEDYLERHPQRATVLLGDFNDIRSSESLAPLFAMPFTDPLTDQLRGTGRNPSTYWPRRRMRIDHILLSPAAQACVRQGSARIHSGRQAKQASDHYPVSLELDMPSR